MQTYPVTSKVRVVAPAREPLTLAEAKAHLRVDGVDEDVIISALISMAREKVESVTGRALCPQTWDFFWGQFPGVRPYCQSDEIILPLAPVSAVTDLAYTITTGAITHWTVSGANLLNEFGALNAHIDTNTTPPRIRLAYSCIWPNQVLQTANGVRVRCTVGYPAWAGTVTVTGGVNITKTGGDAFDPTWMAGKRIVIAGVPVLIASVASPTSLVLMGGDESLPDGTSKAYYVDDIPDMIRSAMKLYIGHLYENREAVTDGTLTVGAELPLGINAMLIDHKVWSFA